MKKKIIALFLAAAMSLSLAACGGNAPASSAAPKGSAASGQTKTAAPDQDLVVGFNLDIQSLDPHQVSDTLSMSLLGTMYEQLVTID